MKNTIEAFLESKEIAIAGVSPNKGNWGQALVKELEKQGKVVYPINPLYDEVEGKTCLKSVKNLPETVENLILAVNPERSREIIKDCEGTGIKRVWLNQAMGDGAYSPEAVEMLKDKKIEFVYGFCPMMFFGGGMHKFHFWLRKTFGKTPVEFTK
ncbi:CoA-binding protein [Bacteroidota bacterium]